MPSGDAVAFAATVTEPTDPVAATPSTETSMIGEPHGPSFQVDLPQPVNEVDEGIF